MTSNLTRVLLIAFVLAPVLAPRMAAPFGNRNNEVVCAEPGNVDPRCY